jgi:site-specific recombinase XerD
MFTAGQFHRLAEVSAVIEWIANAAKPRTQRAYSHHVKDFASFVGIRMPEEFRSVTRTHVIAWRDELNRRSHSPATIRAKLSALSSFFEYLCEKNSVANNPVKGVQRS